MIAIARIARPHGLRGEVVADLLTDYPDRFAVLEKVLVVRGTTVIGTLELENYRFHKQRIVLKFADYDNADKAEELRDARLLIDPAEAVALDDDEYFIFDLVGCNVTTITGQSLGNIVRVDDFGAAPLLIVQESGQEWMIPFTRDICPDVDLVGKKIIVNPPVGLLDL